MASSPLQNMVIGVVLFIIAFYIASAPSTPTWLNPAIGGAVGLGGVITIILIWKKPN